VRGPEPVLNRALELLRFAQKFVGLDLRDIVRLHVAHFVPFLSAGVEVDRHAGDGPLRNGLQPKEPEARIAMTAKSLAALYAAEAALVRDA
jgi:hypothetical protein